MMNKRTGQLAVLLLTVALSLAAQAFQPVPRESAKALRVTRGKSFAKGVVFVNGKYLAPPYVVERWGTGLRINKVPVSGQIIDWDEFLKTQDGVKVTKAEPAPVPAATPAPAAAMASAPAAAEEDSDESSLDDLFDDDPKPKKKKSASGRSAGSKKAASSAAAKSAAETKPKQPSATYELEGEFVANDASKALVARINAARTDIDRLLRKGGFICFGDRYSQVTGDARTLMRLMEKLPELQQNSSDFQSFYSGTRTAHLDYLHETLCADLFANRVDYPQLKQRRTELKKEAELERVLNGISEPLF